jgi:HK97 gp10 family phage protein
MPNVEIKLTGFDELERKLREFGPKVELSGLRSANYAGAKVIVEAAKRTSAWQDRTGQLRKHIRAFRRTSKRYTVTHSVGLSGIFMKYGNTSENRRKRRVGKRYAVEGPYFYGRFLEFGTSKMQARPWLRPAFLANVDNAIDAIKDGMYAAVVRAAAR